jgi:hypothetical protein
MQLDQWIDSRHLAHAARVACRSAFALSPTASIVIDNFLRADKFAALQQVFSTEGEFEDRYYLWQPTEDGRRETAVPVETWRAAPAARRASLERVLVGARPAYRMGIGMLAHLKFVELLRSPELMDFFQSVTGIRPATLTGFVTRVMVGGQYIQPHSDYWHIRDLCGVFYASGGWQESFGGRFRHRGPGPEIVPVEPRANRLLLFEPRSDCMHDVEAIADAGKGWERWACSMWFGTPVSSEGEKESPATLGA